MTVRCRIAPSPTGPLHIGTARTALFNLLFARHEGGTFILRLEDTDVARSTAAYEADILSGLHWLGIDWDEGPAMGELAERGPFGPYRQMARLESYRAAVEGLLSRDQAYECFCSTEQLAADRASQEAAGQPPRYIGRCAHLTAEQRAQRRAEHPAPVIRFRIPAGRVGFHDLVRGDVSIDTSALGGDLVIVRSDGTPLYHFTVCVDDATMGISHVIRGEDHLSNTPKHILLFRALGAEVPAFAHLPLILNPDRTKMSKRKSQTAVADYIDQGYIREALINHLALLGWSSGTDDELFSFDDLVERFDLSRVQQGGAIFDRERLDWLNGQWIRRLSDVELVERSLPFLRASLVDAETDSSLPTADDLLPLVPLVRERLPRLDAMGPLVDFLFLDHLSIEPTLLVPKRWDAATTIDALTEARRIIAATGETVFEAEELEPPLRALAETRGWKAGDLFMAIRVALTGRTATPPLFDTMVALGYARTLERLDGARLILDPATSGT
ncbi:MAG: glutamate--tRNA ligase [Chloroflexi bacterium]|nr:glutamate--tRNA ligase [Chloroflexota bacterium]